VTFEILNRSSELVDLNGRLVWESFCFRLTSRILEVSKDRRKGDANVLSRGLHFGIRWERTLVVLLVNIILQFPCLNSTVRIKIICISFYNI
jgi:hypothetical protein